MHSDRVTTTATEGRKSSKPIMEKRRRARINASLAELKSLLLEVIKKEGARHSKMEKADILEMAVKHLRQVQRQQYTSGGTDPTLSDKYRLGFNECAQEVSRYLGAADDDDAELRARLLNHLANCITSSDSSPLSTPSSSPPAPLVGHVSSSGTVVGTHGGGVTPVTPIPVRPVSKGSVTGLSLMSQGEAGGGGGGGSPPTAAVLVPSTEINNNNVAMVNNNVVHALTAGGAALVAAGADVRNGSHQMTLSPAASSPASVPAGRKVMGEVQVVGAKAGGGGGGGGEVALVLPANVMTGGPLPSYIIPVYASPHPLSAASLSLTPSTSLPHPNLSFTPTTLQAPAATFPLSLPVMTSPYSTNAQVSTTTTTAPGHAAAPSLVTLTPGAALSPAVFPPSSVGHVIATGLKAPMTWQAATTVYSACPSSVSSSALTPSSSSSSYLLASSSAGLSALTLAAGSSEMKAEEERVTSSVSVQSMVPVSAAVSYVSVPADSSEAAGDGSRRLSLLHSQLMRPQGSMAAAAALQSADGCVWRPW